MADFTEEGLVMVFTGHGERQRQRKGQHLQPCAQDLGKKTGSFTVKVPNSPWIFQVQAEDTKRQQMLEITAYRVDDDSDDALRIVIYPQRRTVNVLKGPYPYQDVYRDIDLQRGLAYLRWQLLTYHGDTLNQLIAPAFRLPMPEVA